MHSSGRIHNKGTRCKSLAAFLPVSVCIVCYRNNNVQCSLVFPRKHYFTFVSSSSTHRDSHSAGVCRRLSTVQTNLRTVTHRAQHTANFFILTYICRVRSVCVYCLGFFWGCFPPPFSNVYLRICRRCHFCLFHLYMQRATTTKKKTEKK